MAVGDLAFYYTLYPWSNQGGLLQPPPFIIRTEPPMKLILVSIGRYGPPLFIHTKMSTIYQGVT